jgi:rifampin ADP-ribosylating transferase
MTSAGPESDRSDPAGDEPVIPVTLENSGALPGPFFHGTAADLRVGDELRPGFTSNFHEGRVMNHVYFAGALEPAVWGAELASALGACDRRGRIYVVEPTGPFEDDPNLTNRKFAGNPTRSFRTRHPLRVVGEVTEWEGHPPEVLDGMLESLARLREQGLDVIED